RARQRARWVEARATRRALVEVEAQLGDELARAAVDGADGVGLADVGGGERLRIAGVQSVRFGAVIVFVRRGRVETGALHAQRRQQTLADHLFPTGAVGAGGGEAGGPEGDAVVLEGRAEGFRQR